MIVDNQNPHGTDVSPFARRAMRRAGILMWSATRRLTAARAFVKSATALTGCVLMLKGLPLRWRLSLLLGLMLAAGLSAGFALLVLHAGARIRAEAEAATALAREFVVEALARADATPDAASDFRHALAAAQSLRHVRIYVDDGASPAPVPDRRAPEWFLALAAPRASETRIAPQGRAYLAGPVVIAARPLDEIAEIWEEIVWLAAGGAALALLAFATLSLVVTRTLTPLSALADGLERLERGERKIHIAPGASPEFRAIASRVNALAAALARLDRENRGLVRRIIDVQDEERRGIARDLHDEIGPFLFTIRAGVGALARKAASPQPSAASLAADCEKIDGQIAALQEVNRRILGRLRPAALEEMGLLGALEALARGWREARPDVALELDASAADAADGDETIALTAYRVAQEGLTNAFRHSGATRVALGLRRVAHTDGGAALAVTVRDNGAGMGEAASEGMGLRGMSERVGALGGAVALSPAPEGGAELRAILPLDREFRAAQ
jgi:two-component system, NarL family, sensor histidine kinase UhpB